MRYQPAGHDRRRGVGEIPRHLGVRGGEWARPTTDRHSDQTAALEHAVNQFDTADMDGYGHSEEVFRRALGGLPTG